ncbi:membrane protein insertase YidC [Candidatus Babeliales bacterium]|nr:membrane protein insertase YidC [Candidatus Babeliales bacterium]
MNRRLLFALILSITTLLVFNYFNNSRKVVKQISIPTEIRPGQAYRVPTAQDLAMPINLEIDFLDKKIKKEEKIDTYQTDLYVISFSNYGGIVSTIDFKKYLGINKTPLRTVYQKSFFQREEGAFLLALDKKTPYFYDLIESKELDDCFKIVYQSKVDDWIIRKNYVIYKDSYKLDLNLEFETNSKKEDGIRPRIFFPAPFVGEIESDKQNGFVIDLDGKSVNKISDYELDQAWITPEIFGAEDKYFVHAVIGDKQKLIQRTFFKKLKNNIFPILEGPQIKESGKWNLSFYMGPKSLDDLVAVDERLSDLLAFGWLSWICKLLLKLLLYLYSFLNNFGLAIIFLTILLKIPFAPLSIGGRRKMLEYQKHQPSINRIRMKYRKDLKRQQEEILRFHKEHNLSPAAPLLGCLPLLIQMPILFALYRVLGGYLDLYQAPFMLWFTDLSSKDPYYILPILMGISMFWQQKLTPVADSKQKVMMMFMPIIFTALFASFPAGLVLYWLTNNLLTIGETYIGNTFLKSKKLKYI